MPTNNSIFETGIQQLIDGLIFVEKKLCVYVRCMLEISRCLYINGINVLYGQFTDDIINCGHMINSTA